MRDMAIARQYTYGVIDQATLARRHGLSQSQTSKAIRNGRRWIALLAAIERAKERALKSRGYQAASSVGVTGVCTGRKRGYQRRKIPSQSSFSTCVRTCKSRCAPSGVHCICCFFTIRLLTT
jgi:hypothetical protein